MKPKNNKPRVDHAACLHCPNNRNCPVSSLPGNELYLWCRTVRTFVDKAEEMERTPDEDGLLQSWQIAKTALRTLDMN